MGDGDIKSLQCTQGGGLLGELLRGNVHYRIVRLHAAQGEQTAIDKRGHGVANGVADDTILPFLHKNRLVLHVLMKKAQRIPKKFGTRLLDKCADS